MLNMPRSKQWRSLSMITLGVTAAIIGVQLTGGLQRLEWAMLNQWVRLRPPEDRAVPIVVVTLTEADIQRMRRWPLSDAQLAALLNRLKRDRPAAIGLNLYRDLPVEPGHTELLQVFKTTPNLIGITKAVRNSNGAAVAPPPILRDRDQVGVNDLLIDADGTVRRNLLSIDRRSKTTLALGTKLALMYLSKQGITPTVRATDGCIQVGKATFCRLEQNAGGYIRVDTGGYQTLSNFLQSSGGIPSVSLTDVMTNRVPASLFQDKIVLIGTKADSVWGDCFYTPYTTDSNSTWVGVEIHANLTAQIISSALEGRPILQGLPQVWGWGWIVLWA
ncbi:MAG: CHASE2 domain-containing protein, partial [Leptolyngbyaceae cyanobacterium CAN_BIN12]|nr:CHASE2 domain-containing protein [Leptolyngbyaceae cyanobacterium CAN_BIN12]